MALTQANITIDQVGASYGDVRALTDLTLNLGAGVNGLLGPNGAGKSTLLRILATVQTPTEGTLAWFGVRPDSTAEIREVRRQVGYLPQNPGFYPSFRVFDFVHHFALLKEIHGRSQRHSEVERVLEVVELSDRRRSKVRELSGGMRQRLALACAILGDPALIILDEPTVGLDPEQRAAFRETIAALGTRRCVILSTHQTDDIAAMCVRVLVLRGGVLTFDGSPEALTRQADGRVWSGSERSATAVAGWTTGSGSYRNIGVPPPSARLLDPTIDDGYLIVTTAADASGAVR